ncbi:protein PTST homolog 2, chloroplastic isoform X2 [Magnolia sinica]|uniref:protein PTST homolog 2, chloroplastic isoform X2 n=1 Tax=Magnolia sinica TaxID=86752 RepID=UPI00265ADEEB|nr:protein PTST homolog 2, chloroplastic isoform X2 [Magnolia sinica]
MISHHHTTIFLSAPSKCPNFSPHRLFLVVSPRTRNQESHLHHHHHHRQHHHHLLASVGPALFLQRRDEYDERKTRTVSSSSSSLSSSANDDGEADSGAAALEDEILDFMLKSPNPNAFPTREEFIAAGRMDLAEAIAARGGWLAYGWDLDEKPVDSPGDDGSIDSIGGFLLDDSRVFQQRFSGSSTSDQADTTASSSSSGRSIEIGVGEDSGIEGILSRLEKERNLLYAIESGEKEDSGWILGKEGDNAWQGVSTDAVARSERRSRSGKEFDESIDVHFQNGTSSDFNGTFSSLKPEMWRMWSVRRAGFPETEFEAAEIVPYGSGKQRTIDHNFSSDVVVNDGKRSITESMNEIRNTRKELASGDKDNFQSQIHTRLQQLQLELTSVLRVLRSRADAVVLHKGERGSLEELHKLSDAWEFQETEIMKARDKLRSMRAKLAVLEGKMALEIIEAQKIVEERQRRIDDAQKALSILRTACIVWPNSASEVFLAGSFDGWTSQRRMERSTSGIFSLNLKLYPGRYEDYFGGTDQVCRGWRLEN